MLEYLEELLKDIQKIKTSMYIEFTNLDQKENALETAIEILEKLRNNERSLENGNIK